MTVLSNATPRMPAAMGATEGSRELLPWDEGRARGRAWLARGLVRTVLVLLSISSATAITPVDLGGAVKFSTLAKLTLTNTPLSLITGHVTENERSTLLKTRGPARARLAGYCVRTLFL
jgi:hypothetical protein